MRTFLHFLITFVFLHVSVAWAIGEKKQSKGNFNMMSDIGKAKARDINVSLKSFQRFFNKNHQSPAKLAKLFPNEADRKFFLAAIKDNKKFKLPKITLKKGLYSLKSGDIVLTYNLESVFNNHVWINGDKYDLTSFKSVEELTNQIVAKYATKKTTFINGLQNLIIPEANAIPPLLAFYAGMGIAVGVGILWAWLGGGNDFDDAERMMNNFTRYKEVADLCDVNKEAVLENLKAGKGSNINLIYKMLERTDDGGYDQEEVIESLSGEYSDGGCDEFAEELIDGLVDGALFEPAASLQQKKKQNASLFGNEYVTDIEKFEKWVKTLGCEDFVNGVNEKDEAAKVKKQWENLKSCAEKSCNKLATRHDSCISYLHDHIDKSTRKSKASGIDDYDGAWEKPIQMDLEK